MKYGDLISRQAIIDAIQKLNIPEDMCVFEIISHIEVAIATLPSVENKGEWEIYIISMLDGEGCKCSECGFEGVPYWNYCPNCGADMRGEANV